MLAVANQVSHKTVCSLECVELPDRNTFEYPRIWYRGWSKASVKCGRRADVNGPPTRAGSHCQAVIRLVSGFQGRRPKQGSERPALTRTREAAEQGGQSTKALWRLAGSGK